MLYHLSEIQTHNVSGVNTQVLTKITFTSCFNLYLYHTRHSGRDRMVVGITTTYAISAYHHSCCECESRSGRAVQHYYIINFVNDLRQVYITEILLKMALNTINQTYKTYI